MRSLSQRTRCPQACLQQTPLCTRLHVQPWQARPSPSQAPHGVHRAGAACLCLNGVLRLSWNIRLARETQHRRRNVPFLSGKQKRNFQGQHVRSEGFPRWLSGVKNSPAKAGVAGDLGSIPGSGRSPGAGNGNQLQYSCLGNFMDRGAWRAVVPGVTKSQT